MERSRRIAIWLIVLGGVASWISLPWVLRWNSVAPGLRVHVVVFLVASVVMIGCGAALLRRHPSALIRWGASFAAATSGTNLLSGIAAGTIPCAGPG